MKATARCKRCGAPIGFALTVTSRRMPIDPDPDPAGNVFITEGAGPARAVVKSAQHPDPPGVAHFSHFATCPVANEFRRR